MHLDFATEYAKRSDEEIRLLVADRRNLVDEAREALDAEVGKRRRNGFELHVTEPQEPRLHVEGGEDDEDGNVVVVHSRELRFPKICPRCLAQSNTVVKISCDGGSSWGFFPAVDMALGLWRYLFLRYPVPFCQNCALSVRARRWLKRALLAGAFALSAYLGIRHDLSAWRFLILFICLYLAGVAMLKLWDIWKPWAAEGIEILNAWSAKERRLAFARPEYEKAFVALNKARLRPQDRVD